VRVYTESEKFRCHFSSFSLFFLLFLLSFQHGTSDLLKTHLLLTATPMSDAERNPASLRVKDEPDEGDQQQRREVTVASVSDDDDEETPPSLRDYQKEAIAAFHEARRYGLNRIGISAPTGSGKTIIFSTILRQVLEKYRGGKALVIVGTQEQAMQARNKILDAYGRDRVVIGYEESRARADRRDDV